MGRAEFAGIDEMDLGSRYLEKDGQKRKVASLLGGRRRGRDDDMAPHYFSGSLSAKLWLMALRRRLQSREHDVT